MEQWKAVKAQGHIESRPQPEGEAVLQVLACPKRVRVLLGGAVIADSAGVLLLREQGHLPVYYIPRADVRTEHLQRTDHATHCPRKGDATYYTVAAGGRVAENAAWSYEAPSIAGAGALAGHIAFYWERMDAWYEEDEAVFVHPRDPFVRVDILPSTRRVRVLLDGAVLADSTRARFLCETGHPTRYYLPREDADMARLEPSDATTRCPYKGVAQYWHVRLGETLHENLVWTYPEPVREAAPIQGLLCFYAERVDAVEVAPPDGKAPEA